MWFGNSLRLEGADADIRNVVPSPFPIRAGEVHAQRIPKEHWVHRLRLLKGLGLDTVSTYVFWNAVEAEPGHFDWSGENDIAAFCRTAQAEGLKVIIRPGPYACGEWDLGGLPWWLLKDRKMVLRSRYPGFMDATKRYYRALGEQLAPLQATRGGPIVLVQVENEYDGSGSDGAYIEALCAGLRESGFDVPLYTSEMAWALRPSRVPGLIRAVGFSQDADGNFADVRKVQPDGPLFCSELYTGWFDVWGFGSSTASGFTRLTNTLERVLNLGASFNLYMVAGGTSFGFTAGANIAPYRPQPTSYDYGAPVDEAGRPTAKYQAVRTVMARHLPPGQTLPAIPAPYPAMELAPVELKESAALLENLPPVKTSQRPLTFEQLGQGQGCVLYRTRLPAGGAAELTVTEGRDFVIVMIDGKRVGVLDRMRRERSLWLPERQEEATLDLLVEAMGHANYGPQMAEQKGISERVELKDGAGLRELLGWQMFPLPLGVPDLAKLKFTRKATEGPTFYRGRFDVKTIADTFLDLRPWSKGVVWVNGHNLGRFWSVGPQRSLYLPGPWLRKQGNEIVVLDLFGTPKPVVSGVADPILRELNQELAGRLHRKPAQKLVLDGIRPVAQGGFEPGTSWQTARFEPVNSRYVCLEARGSHPGDDFTSCAELDFVGADGRSLPRSAWKVVYADSEEMLKEQGSADRVLDGRPETYWHTRWTGANEPHPHQIVVDLGAEYPVAGIRYLPRQDQANGRIAEYSVYASPKAFPGL